ncbi:FtsW/RodA/SpoVE family cell cycle protein [Gemmiger formicilis]|nr:FtsW/RodA/SpoVE family cell cycle protein [Gemmiger formicilis]
MSTAVSIVRTLLGLLFDHTIGNIVRMIPIIRLPKLERAGRGFLAMLLGILFFGLTMLFSASYSSAYATSGKLYSIIKPQVMIALVGLAFMWLLSNINYRALRLMSESLYIITIVLLILALLSPEDTNGTYRWVYLPGGASFQPSELAKFSLMIWTADMLDRDYDKKNRLWYGAIKPALPLLPILYLLHKEPHNSAMILLCLIFATMLICTLSPGRWLLPLVPACSSRQLLPEGAGQRGRLRRGPYGRCLGPCAAGYCRYGVADPSEHLCHLHRRHVRRGHRRERAEAPVAALRRK